jgi:hypothetical protein
LKLRDFRFFFTPKALHPIAWGQPRSGATPGSNCVVLSYPERVPQCGEELCNPFGVVAVAFAYLGWRRCAADPRLIDVTPKA